MIDLGTVKPGSTIRIPFSSFDKDDGSSITMTNYAAADILIYKDGSTTERASTAGFTATTDFDAKTGKHLAIIDLADNTTSGFYNSGSEYLVAIDAVTVDTVTTGGWIARFRIGYPDATLDTTIATLSSQTSFTLTAGPAEDSALLGCVCLIHDIASAVQHGYAVVSAYTGSTRTVTLTAGVTFTAAAGDNISFFPPSNARWWNALLTVSLPVAPATAGRPILVDANGVADARLADAVSHGGTLGSSTATMALSRLSVVSQSSNTAALTLTGNGTGNGATIASGSGATGTGLAISSAATNGTAATFAGAGTGNGVTSTGGATGHGISAVGGATSGDGLRAAASTSGAGITATGVGTSKSGIVATGGSTSSDGITATGGGTGHGISATSGSGATGNGLTLLAASTNGHGFKSTGTGTGDGMELTAGASGADLDADQVGNFTGNLSGSVGSVTGAVGSVTGNVGGNVTGSVGSVIGAVGSVTGNVGGNVTGSIGSLATQAKADVNAEVDSALDTAIPGTPTANSINERIQTMDNAYTATRAGYLDNINNADLATTAAQTGDAYARLGAPVGASVSADVAAIKSDTAATLLDTGTDGVIVATNNDKTNYRLSATGVSDIGTAILTTALTESYSVDGAAPTLSQAIFAIQQMMQEKSLSSTTMTIRKLDGSTTAMTFTLNDATTPTSITRAS